tara:strand:+ start:1236 stop:1943 length:708 start_codon:yes stop_codon:yes gene_type:complete
MPLPKIDQPLFELTIPSNGETVKFRPFTVKEEKILLIAQESNDIDQVVLSIKQILTNCIQDYNIDKLAVFDLEYILIQIRSKAVNNLLKFRVSDPDTEEMVDLELDIDEIEIVRNEDHKKIIRVTDTISLSMKYPSIDFIKVLRQGEDSEDQSAALFDLMRDCIDTVVEGESVYKISEFTVEEVTDFIDTLDGNVLNLIKEFFDTIPKMRFETKYKLKDGTEKTFVAEGTETFFI